ncbi:hypothetical protein IQ260_16255 [Leptolyngbya cf. ectocarpi LEGE 11479]|uniref:HNH endonuclease n=1 Tax=Leptolyngbya cf. ectocarpi LEGE 11479 TaxID=1828722 RepID=A0A928ZVH2_LEPEC|nr:hypothetical protein [Leptolyngbya ectocarpi]MBE9068204.1 hypothetical protein [Leptolyngbya cf. ectocarpi LEGE 11479]
MINAKRSPEPPKSLLQSKRWNDRDVLEQLHADFLGKCYLTEEVLSLGQISVDHFRPKGELSFKDLIYEWGNLYPTSRNANERRPKKWPEGGLLDPASPEDDVENRLQQWLDDDFQPKFAATDTDDSKAMNTASQLDHIHNDMRSIKAADLRSTIQTYYVNTPDRIRRLEPRSHKDLESWDVI